MKSYEKGILAALLALLLVTLTALILTHGWADYRDQLRALRASSTRPQDAVDTRPLDSAQQLAALAVTRTERDYAEAAERLADRSTDLAFAAAIHDAAENPAPLTPERRRLADRITAGETAVAGDQNRVTQYTQILAKATGSSKDALQGLLVTAQAQLTLDQDDLDAAKQDLILAGGDKQAQIQQLLDQHKASDANSASASAAAAASAASAPPSIELTQSTSIVAECRAWNSLHTKGRRLIQAREDALALVTTLSATRAERQQRMEGMRNGATQTQTSQPQPSPILSLQQQTENKRNLADLGQRIAAEQQLAAVYANWITFVGVREKAFLHEMLISIFTALLIAVLVLLANYGVQRFFAEVNLEHRQLRTMQALMLFSVQAVGLLLILLVIFGVPGNLATVLALAGAGLTVAMKDFIVGFFGWFVLMGKDGIHVGDWVEINGVGGEVTQVGLLHTVVLETGNWADAGHPTGRKVSFVNSFAIEGHYFNFSTSGQWLWDEIQVPVPDGTDPYATAEAIQKIAAEETSANVHLAETEWNRVAPSYANRTFSATPSLSVRPTAEGITIVLRYITRANERYEVRGRLYREVVELLHKRGDPEAAVSESSPARAPNPA